MSGSAAARDPEAKRRYLASGRQDGAARTQHGADIAAYLPAEPVATFTAAGKQWHVFHARNLKGLRTFQRVVALLVDDATRPNQERLFELLGTVVGGKWEGDRWISELPASVADELTFNELDDLVTLATVSDGRPPKGEEATSARSAASSPSTAASIPETASGS